MVGVGYVRRWWLILVLVLIPGLTHAKPAQSLPILSLPTPVGEPWMIIQGYACGTHNAWDRYSIDLVSANGTTRGAPVRAAADGVIFAWTKASGTLILRHGDGVYTMYTHMASVVTTHEGTSITRGQQIGTVGDRGSPGTPHLHFTAFTGDGDWARNRNSFPLHFVEGYTLPETKGCSQHQGLEMTAQIGLDEPGVRFETALAPNTWTNQNLMVSFGGAALSKGYRAAWNAAPDETAPVITTRGGSVQLADAGEGLHTLFVRGWNAQGEPITAQYGPIGYDITAPELSPWAEPLRLPTGTTQLTWTAASDRASGVAGYRIYLGSDPNGVSDWYSTSPSVALPALSAGTQFLRLQALDYAGNASAWLTLGTLVVE